MTAPKHSRNKIACESCVDGAPLRIAGFEYGMQDNYHCESCGHTFHPYEAMHGPDSDGCVWHHDTIRCLDLQRESRRIQLSEEGAPKK